MGNREALLEGAVTCLAEKGYARTTARDLVAASGTNLGAIGYHFGSKEQLLNEALYAGFVRWLDDVVAKQPAVQAGDDPGRLVETAIGGFLDGLDAHRGLCVAFGEALAQAERSPELRAQMAAGYERYRRAVADRLRTVAADLSEPDARVLASLVVAVGDGLLIQWMLDRDAVPDAGQILGCLGGLWRR